MKWYEKIIVTGIVFWCGIMVLDIYTKAICPNDYARRRLLPLEWKEMKK